MTFARKLKASPTPAIHLAICVPSHDMVHSSFAFDLARMMGRLGASVVADGVAEVSIKHVAGTAVHHARNQLVQDLLDEGRATHAFWLDADMRFPWDAPLRLLAHNTPIVGCNYASRKADEPRPVAFRDIMAPSSEPYRRWLFPEEQEPPLVEVHSMGFGCALVQTGVFRAMTRPWFNMVYESDGRFTGEDVYFCDKARRELGISTFIDTALSRELAHSGLMEYRLAHVEAVADEVYGPRPAPETTAIA